MNKVNLAIKLSEPCTSRKHIAASLFRVRCIPLLRDTTYCFWTAGCANRLCCLNSDSLGSHRWCKITARALGCELREEEMKRILSEVSKEGSGKINLESFLQVMTQKTVGEPRRSQRVTFLLPTFTVQVATVDWVTWFHAGETQEWFRSFI